MCDINPFRVGPDRVVVYLWPKAGGVSFTAPSTLYDYYNPEATVVVPPSVFTVR